MLDGQLSSIWRSEYKSAQLGFLHCVVMDHQETTGLTGIRYLARFGSGTPGRIKDYRVYVSDQPFGLTPATAYPVRISPAEVAAELFP